MYNKKSKSYLSDNLGAIVGLLVSISLIAISIYLTTITIQESISADKAIQYVLLLLTILFSTLLLERVVFFSINKDKNKALIDYFDDVSKKSNEAPILYGEQERFIPFCENADEIFMVGLTKVGSIAETANFIINKIKSGTKIRALIIDPREKKLIEYVSNSTNHSSERLKIDTLQSKETIKYITNQLNPDELLLFEVRTYKSTPAVGFIYIKTLEREEMQVYFYVYKTDPSNRISLKLTSDDNLNKIKYFLRQYEILWNDSSPIIL